MILEEISQILNERFDFIKVEHSNIKVGCSGAEGGYLLAVCDVRRCAK